MKGPQLKAYQMIVPGLLLLTALLPLRAATYFVAQGDSKASDGGPGTAELPWKTLTKAAEKVTAGDVVVIRDGIYRERVLLKADGTAEQPIRFEAAPGAQVVLTGADRITAWQKGDDTRPVWRAPWPHRFITWSKHMTHPDDDYHRLIGRCEQVAIDNYLLRQVLEQTQLAPGTFWVDLTNQLLHAWDPANRELNKVFAEASVRQEILRVEGAHVRLGGLRFRLAANMAQHGAVHLSGAHDLLADCVVEAMNSSGASFTGEDQIVRRCVFRDNGQLGFGANGAHRLLFTECLVENNNIKGFDRGWEAGGDKLVLCRDVVLERSQFLRNRGNGIWFDIGNEHCAVRQCLIADNEDGGIFYEISFGLQAYDNVILGNGFAATSGAWGAQAGISLSSSPECLLERNLLVGNREGFNFREQTRTTTRIGKQGEVPIWNHDETIRHNLIALNRDAQIWGWFDMKDNRHWPAAAGAAARSSPSEGLTLESLHLRFENNLYGFAPGQGAFEWGVTWGRHKSYPKLSDFQGDLGIDIGGQMIEPAFANIRARDFRLSQPKLNELAPSYPRGPVPGVLLGLKP